MQNAYMYKGGGFAFGLGEVAVSASSTTATFPTTAPGTPVRADRLTIDPHTAASTAVAAELGCESITLDDADLDLNIGADVTGPVTIYAPNSVVNPSFGSYVSRDAALTVTLSNANTADVITAAGAFRAQIAASPEKGIEGAVVAAGPVLGIGRVIHLGGSTDTGADRAGTPQSAKDLLLFHLVIQAVNDDLLVDELKLDDYDYLTGGTAPVRFWDHVNPAFSFHGIRVDKSTTISLSTTGGTSGFHTEGITAQLT